MPFGERKYVLDTNLFIRAFRDPEANAALTRFHAAFAPFEYLSAIVAQELRAGAQSEEHLNRLEDLVLGVYGRRGRVFAPSRTAWETSGDVLAKLAWEEGLEAGRVSKAFGNDVLLALSCREAGMVLLTENARDFARVRRHVQFEYASPWPDAAAR
jgi:predicted nucleic acid-binding protein